MNLRLYFFRVLYDSAIGSLLTVLGHKVDEKKWSIISMTNQKL
jgi:hypothetical protein